MSPLTRVEAMKKMEAFKVKIGFPDKWIDYSTFKVEKGQALKNFYASNAFGFQLDLNRCVYVCRCACVFAVACAYRRVSA
jgi:putative endopeptidase